MDETLVHRYAEAFVNALERSKRIGVGLKELETVAGAYRASGTFRAFLDSPSIPQAQKWELIGRVWSEAIGPEGMGLLHLLLRWRRLEGLWAIAKAAGRIAEARQGVIRGEIVTARPISTSEIGTIAQAVGQRLGKRVILEPRVDPRLLGGVRVFVGTTLLDRSVERLLKEVESNLKQVKVG